MTPIETPVAADAAVTLSSAPVSTTSAAPASAVAVEAAPETALETALETAPEAIPVQSSAYRDRLNPWCVVRLSEQAPVTVARFRRRPDAEAHLRLLTQAKRDKFAIVFSNPTDNIAE